MKKRTVIRVHTFVWVVVLILLVSSTIGTPVWAKKSDNPGKPEPPPPETATFRISIGVEGEDVVLTDSFDVVTTDEGWYPKEKGKPRSGQWKIPLWEESDGVYAMQKVWSEENETYLTEWYHGEAAQLFGLEHHWDLHIDYWLFGINWTSNLNGEPLMLVGATDRGREPEGSYDAENDVWTVTFTTVNAYFGVGWCEGGSCWLYWCGYLEFTVTIEKISSS